MPHTWNRMKKQSSQLSYYFWSLFKKQGEIKSTIRKNSKNMAEVTILHHHLGRTAIKEAGCRTRCIYPDKVTGKIQ